jgi:hypothetical protein
MQITHAMQLNICCSTQEQERFAPDALLPNLQEGGDERHDRFNCRVANAWQYAEQTCLVQLLTVVHRLCELDVAEVAWTIMHVGAICGADATKLVHCPHAGVTQAASLSHALLKQLSCLHLAHRVLFLWVHQDSSGAAGTAVPVAATACSFASVNRHVSENMQAYTAAGSDGG